MTYLRNKITVSRLIVFCTVAAVSFLVYLLGPLVFMGTIALLFIIFILIVVSISAIIEQKQKEDLKWWDDVK